MAEIPLTPLIAFGVYLLLSVGLSLVAGRFAATSPSVPMKTSIYGSGEAAPERAASPGYGKFFLGALFFASLHLAVLVLGTSSLQPVVGLYVLGLLIVLFALVLG